MSAIYSKLQEIAKYNKKYAESVVFSYAMVSLNRYKKIAYFNHFQNFTKCEVSLNHFLSRSIFDKQDLVSVCRLQLIK